MPVSIFDIVRRGAELANKDTEVLKEIADYDGDKVGIRFTDDVPVTLITDKGKIAVESKERPDSKVVLEMSAISFCKLLDKTIGFMEIREHGRIAKGEVPDLVDLMYAFSPFFNAMIRYYSENSEFRKMVEERKSRK